MCINLFKARATSEHDVITIVILDHIDVIITYGASSWKAAKSVKNAVFETPSFTHSA